MSCGDTQVLAPEHAPFAKTHMYTKCGGRETTQITAGVLSGQKAWKQHATGLGSKVARQRILSHPHVTSGPSPATPSQTTFCLLYLL